MATYRYVLERDGNGYIFILYPNNIINQEVGRSIKYFSKKECLEALNDFKLFVKINKIDNYNSAFINVFKKGDFWHFQYIKDGEIIFYRLMGYYQKQSAKKVIASIYRHIDAEIKDE